MQNMCLTLLLHFSGTLIKCWFLKFSYSSLSNLLAWVDLLKVPSIFLPFSRRASLWGFHPGGP